MSEQFRDGDGDQPEFAGAAVAGPLRGGGHGEEGVGEQADRSPAVPGGPGGDLACVEPGDLLRELVILLSQPPLIPVKKESSLALRGLPARY
jgi:hypothetical protein